MRKPRRRERVNETERKKQTERENAAAAVRTNRWVRFAVYY